MNTQQLKAGIKDHLSGYELTYNTIKNLARYDITPTAKLVLVLLTTHYNNAKNGAVVFPSMPTIADTLGIGLTATKKAIKDLIEAGAIIKAKRNKVRGNCNKYALTTKVLNTTVKQSKNELFKRSDCDLFMITSKENLNNQSASAPEAPQQHKEVVIDFSSKSSKKHNRVILEEVAETIRNNPKIKNPCAYWATLTEAERKTIFDRENQEKEKAARREKLKKEAAEAEAREEAERKAFEALPIEQRQPKGQTIRNIWHTRHFLKQGKKPFSYLNEAIAHYNLDYIKIANMTAEQVEAYIETC